MADPTIAPNTPPTDSEVILIFPLLAFPNPVSPNRSRSRPIRWFLRSKKALQPSIDLASGGLAIMQLSDVLNNLGRNPLDAPELLFLSGIHHPILARQNGLGCRQPWP
jgi:hypothetical protein